MSFKYLLSIFVILTVVSEKRKRQTGFYDKEQLKQLYQINEQIQNIEFKCDLLLEKYQHDTSSKHNHLLKANQYLAWSECQDKLFELEEQKDKLLANLPMMDIKNDFVIVNKKFSDQEFENDQEIKDMLQEIAKYELEKSDH